MKDTEHPIQFIRAEILNVLEQMKTRNFESQEGMKTVIDLACENIIEHFGLTEVLTP